MPHVIRVTLHTTTDPPERCHCCGVQNSAHWLQSRRSSEREDWESMAGMVRKLWLQDDGQDVAEYAVMLAVVVIVVLGTIRLIGSNSSNVFSAVGSSIGGL